MNPEDAICLFGMSHQRVERELDGVEDRLSLDLGRRRKGRSDKDQDYYPQFDHAVRKEAAEMAAHYEVFYCLETSIRSLVADKLESEHGANWWNTQVPQAIKDNVARNIQKEVDSGVTSRSDAEIDFTTFGELGEIVRHNWAAFGDLFSSQKAFDKVMTSLNLLRGPIAHCSKFAPDEVVRLQLTVRDWFRLME